MFYTKHVPYNVKAVNAQQAKYINTYKCICISIWRLTRLSGSVKHVNNYTSLPNMRNYTSEAQTPVVKYVH